MQKKIETFREWISQSDNIVFFGGAGVSTESGIPDFRSVDGLYNQKYEYPPETILSHTFFHRNPEEFYRFYRDKLLVRNVQPNITHEVLAKMERVGKLRCVVTQNIDGLHQLAGSKNVLELHGSTLRNFCMHCGKRYGIEIFDQTQGIPRCTCGGIIRPDVVLYEEGLDDAVVRQAVQAIRQADMLIVGGTSLVVYPAAGLINDYRGKKLVLINQSPTSYDARADLLICDRLGAVFGAVRDLFE